MLPVVVVTDGTTIAEKGDGEIGEYSVHGFSCTSEIAFAPTFFSQHWKASSWSGTLTGVSSSFELSCSSYGTKLAGSSVSSQQCQQEERKVETAALSSGDKVILISASFRWSSNMSRKSVKLRCILRCQRSFVVRAWPRFHPIFLCRSVALEEDSFALISFASFYSYFRCVTEQSLYFVTPLILHYWRARLARVFRVIPRPYQIEEQRWFKVVLQRRQRQPTRRNNPQSDFVHHLTFLSSFTYSPSYKLWCSSSCRVRYAPAAFSIERQNDRAEGAGHVRTGSDEHRLAWGSDASSDEEQRESFAFSDPFHFAFRLLSSSSSLRSASSILNSLATWWWLWWCWECCWWR